MQILFKLITNNAKKMRLYKIQTFQSKMNIFTPFSFIVYFKNKFNLYYVPKLIGFSQCYTVQNNTAVSY